MILHVFSIKTIPLLRPLGLSPQGGRYRGILLYTYLHASMMMLGNNNMCIMCVYSDIMYAINVD